jgi:hypothetical protein
LTTSPFLSLLPTFLPAALYEIYTYIQSQKENKKSNRLLKQEALTRILQQESPEFEEERKAKREQIEMESKELNNGRLAMLAAVGMLAQEVATGRGLFF